MVHEGDVGIFEAVVKALWGTDAACKQQEQRREGERMIAEAEAAVADLQRVLDDRPPRNLDEAVYGITRGRRE